VLGVLNLIVPYDAAGGHSLISNGVPALNQLLLALQLVKVLHVEEFRAVKKASYDPPNSGPLAIRPRTGSPGAVLLRFVVFFFFVFLGADEVGGLGLVCVSATEGPACAAGRRGGRGLAGQNDSHHPYAAGGWVGWLVGVFWIFRFRPC